ASASGWSGDAPSSVAWQWYSGADAIDGATSATYTPVSGDNLSGIRAVATPSDTYPSRSSASYVVRDAPPAVNSAPSISGSPVVGQTLTGVLGTFTGSGLTTEHVWQVSDDGTTGWADTASTGTTGPVMVEGNYYRLVSSTANSGGAAAAASSVIGPAISITARTIASVTAGTWTGSAQPLTIVSDAQDGDDVYLVIVPEADAAPAPEEVAAGEANGGGAPLGIVTGVWPGPFSATLDPGVARQNAKAYAVIDNGVLSEAVASAAFLVDSTAAILSSLIATADGSDIDVSVTSNDAVGEIFFAVRLSSNPQLSAANIINGTGDALDTDSDDTPEAGSGNLGGFIGLGAATYVVDAVQVDDRGNVSAVVSSAEVTISTFSVFRVGNFQSSGYLGTNPTFPLNQPEVLAGDTVYIFYGRNAIPTAMSINGNPMTPVESNGGSNGFGTHCFSYVMPVNGTSSDVLSITLATSTNEHAIEKWAVRGSHSLVKLSAYSATGFSTSIAPTSAMNAILGVSIGKYQVNSVTWGGLTEVADGLAATNHVTSARLDNAPTGSATAVTVTNEVNDRSGLVLLAISAE
ncbi:hypothetical protein ACFO5X_14140, partial [Seohaeicola nanhaiensis]